MTRPFSLFDTVLNSRWFREPMRRRVAATGVAFVLALLSFFPRHYLSESEILWEDTNGQGLSAILGRAAGGGISLGALIGTHESIEADLTIARSEAVVRDVVNRLKLVSSSRYRTEGEAELAVRHRVSIAALRGSVLQVETRDKDPAFALALVRAYVEAIDDRLKAIAIAQADRKYLVTTTQLSIAKQQLTEAQAKLTSYRIDHRLADPGAELGAALAQLTNLQAQLDAQRAQLATLGKFERKDNIDYMISESRVAALQEQVNSAISGSKGNPVSGMNSISDVLSEYENLYRDDRYYQSLYEIYVQYLQGIAVDRISANSNMDVIEPPYIHPGWDLNISMFGALVIFVMIWGAVEFYHFKPAGRIGVREPK